MPVTVLFDLPIRPDAQDVESIVSTTLAQTAAFPGSEGVRILVDDEDPHRVVCVLRWTTMDDYDRYRAWRQTPAGAHRLFEITQGTPVTRRFSTSIPV